MRQARVGAAFWLKPAAVERPFPQVLRVRGRGEAAALASGMAPRDREDALWVDRRAARSRSRPVDRAGSASSLHAGDVDPWSVLGAASILHAHGDDEWIAVARLAGASVHVLSPGRFGAPGDDESSLDARLLATIAQAAYRDPFTSEATDALAVVEILADWRRMLDANRRIAAASGMAWWKRAEIRRLLWSPQRRLRIAARPGRALAIADRAKGSLAIWPSRISPALPLQAARRQVPLVRVEDGFVRSVGLGSNLVPPSSIVVDFSGIHFDPTAPSDLETILAETRFSPRLLERAVRLRAAIVEKGISKYAAGSGGAAPPRTPGRKLVMVTGQVEDDMSVLAGGGGLASNLELLHRARALEPDAELWFRPHPDVDAGHRKGAVPDEQVLDVADRVVREPAMSALLATVDEVHVLTSLAGFEALLRGRSVTCHGTPFYAGWGLTRDRGVVPSRRRRALSLEELIAGVLILYPRYLDPVSGLPCPPEVLIERMAQDRASNRLGWIEPVRRAQGRLMALVR